VRQSFVQPSQVGGIFDGGYSVSRNSPKSNYYTNGNGVNINSNISPGHGFHQVNQLPQ
jgi:hypothetical protein